MHGSLPTDGVCEITLESDEPEALVSFYETIFGLERLSEEDDRIWLACGERCRLGIWRPGEKEFGDRGGRHVHFALSVRPGALDGLAARLAEHGARAEGPIEHDGGDRSLYLRDPAGNVVEAWDFFERDCGRDVEDLADPATELPAHRHHRAAHPRGARRDLPDRWSGRSGDPFRDPREAALDGGSAGRAGAGPAGPVRGSA